MTVATVPLGEVAEFVRGITFKPDDVVPLEPATSVACLRTKNVQGEVDLDDVWAVSPLHVRRSEQYLQTGDVLVSSANSWNLVGKCSWIPELPWPATFGGFVTVLRPRADLVDRRYLYHWFNHDRTQELVRSFGRKTTNISNLDLKRCQAMSIPLPPIEEQRRIAAVLDAADALRAKRRQALAKLDTLTQAIFIDMFGDISQPAPDAVPFGEFAVLQRGFDLPVDRRTPGAVPIWAANGPVGTHVTAKVPGPGVVTGRSGTIGKVAHVESDFWPLNTALYVRDFVGSEPLYVCWAMRNFRLERFSRGVGVPTLNRNLVHEAPIRVPTVDEQRRFADLARSVAERSRLLSAQDDVLVELFGCLQQRAFRGEL